MRRPAPGSGRLHASRTVWAGACCRGWGLGRPPSHSSSRYDEVRMRELAVAQGQVGAGGTGWLHIFGRKKAWSLPYRPSPAYHTRVSTIQHAADTPPCPLSPLLPPASFSTAPPRPWSSEHQVRHTLRRTVGGAGARRTPIAHHRAAGGVQVARCTCMVHWRRKGGPRAVASAVGRPLPPRSPPPPAAASLSTDLILSRSLPPISAAAAGDGIQAALAGVRQQQQQP